MKTNLLVFTSSFPYGLGENFLATELPYLAREFDLVTLVPMNGADGVLRNTPDNVAVADPLWTTSAQKRRFYLQAMLHRATWSYVIAETLAAIKSGINMSSSLKAIFRWSCYRSALERSNQLDRIVAKHSNTTLYSYWGGVTSLFLLKGAALNLPTCLRLHGYDLYAEQSLGYFPWRSALAKTAHPIFISQHGERYFLKNWGQFLQPWRGNRVFRLGSRFGGLNPSKATMGEDALVLASCSFIYGVKRVHLVAKLAKELSKSQPVIWHHFGGGDDSKLALELASVDAARLTVVMHGSVPHDDIMTFYRENHIDLFVNLSSSEGIPVSIMEAISFGIPVVATDVGGVSEIVVSGNSGLLIDSQASEDSEALAATVLHELKRDGAIACSQPHSFWAEHYDAEKNFTVFARMLRNLGSTSERAEP